MGDPSRPTGRFSKVSFPGTFLLLHSKVFIYAYCTIVGGGEDIHDISFPFGYSKHAADPELQIKSVTLRRSFAHKEYGVSGTGTRGRYYYVSPLGGTQKDRQTPPTVSGSSRERQVQTRSGQCEVVSETTQESFLGLPGRQGHIVAMCDERRHAADFHQTWSGSLD